MEFTTFEVAIKNFLDKHAQDDPTFAPTYAKTNKSIAECCKYIKQEVEKNCRKGGSCVAVSDEEVYGLAIHYYDEDDIVVSGPKNKVEVAQGATSETPNVPEVAKEKRKTRKTRQPKEVADPNIPEPLDIPIF